MPLLDPIQTGSNSLDQFSNVNDRSYPCAIILRGAIRFEDRIIQIAITCISFKVKDLEIEFHVSA